MPLSDVTKFWHLEVMTANFLKVIFYLLPSCVKFIQKMNVFLAFVKHYENLHFLYISLSKNLLQEVFTMEAVLMA